MKVVVIGTVSSSIFGFRKLLLVSLVKAGHDVIIMTSDLPIEVKERAKSELNVQAEKYDLDRSGINPFIDIVNAWRLFRRLKVLKPDLVLCYFSKPVIWGTLAATFAGVKRRYAMLEGLGYYFTDSPAGDSVGKVLVRTTQVALFHLSLPFLKGLVVLNPDDKRDLVERYRIPVKSVSVLGGIGLDLNEYCYAPPREERVRFVFVGRLLLEKGINEFLSAAESIKAHHPEVEFVILGESDPDNPGSVEAMYLDKLVDQGIIMYPGAVSNVVEWLEDSSVFVLPSYREGFPRSTQEAMSIGRAVITTDVPGCRETVIDGQNGFKIPPHDAVALACAMERFILQPDLILKMGLRSRQIAEEAFDADRVNKRLFEMLEL